MRCPDGGTKSAESITFPNIGKEQNSSTHELAHLAIFGCRPHSSDHQITCESSEFPVCAFVALWSTPSI